MADQKTNDKKRYEELIKKGLLPSEALHLIEAEKNDTKLKNKEYKEYLEEKRNTTVKRKPATVGRLKIPNIKEYLQEKRAATLKAQKEYNEKVKKRKAEIEKIKEQAYRTEENRQVRKAAKAEVSEYSKAQRPNIATNQELERFYNAPRTRPKRRPDPMYEITHKRFYGGEFMPDDPFLGSSPMFPRKKRRDPFGFDENGGF